MLPKQADGGQGSLASSLQTLSSRSVTTSQLDESGGDESGADESEASEHGRSQPSTACLVLALSSGRSRLR
jgi:hypothetical protein